MPKTLKEETAVSHLVDPAFDPDTDNKKSLVGVDLTEPGVADISKTGKVFLGSYLRDYVVDGRHNSGKGNELLEEKPFTNQNDAQHLQTTDFFEKSDLSNLLDKTGKDPRHSGHDLLRNVSSAGLESMYIQPEQGSYQQFVVEKLIASNLYHPTEHSPFVNNPDASNEELATKGLFTIQRDLGSFVLSGSSGKNPASGVRVKVSDMSRMALALMAQATGDQHAANTIIDGNVVGVWESVLHTTEQLGIKGVPVHRLRLKGLSPTSTHIKNLVAAARGNDDLLQTVSQNSLSDRGITDHGPVKWQSSALNSVSYTQLNSFLEPFGGLTGSGGMLVIAIEGVLALLSVSLLISALNGTVGSGGSDYVNPNNPHNYAFGSHGKKSSNSIENVLYKLLRITKTDYDFANCVEAGIMLLLGFSPELGTAGFKAALLNPGSLGVFALNLALSPSYYANLFRQIVRDANEIAAKYKEIGGSFSSGIGSIAALAEKLTSSKAYQFVMIAAGVGDAALKSSTGQFDVGSLISGIPGSSYAQKLFLKNDQNPEGYVISADQNARHLGKHRQQVSRWEGGRNPLSLHTFLASNVRQSETIAGNTVRKAYIPSPDTVREIERDLEAEYMPFYFHDLRTHEVLSLPAFVTQFSENFAVNYTSNKGYGRQDAVKTYESAERSMNFGFKLVAFNKADFDEMWLLVNKLVAMCYPQYSKGRQREYRQGEMTYRFTQPFSQIPAASPVIRLRFGDVLKSNYSEKTIRKQFDLQGQGEGEVHRKYNEARIEEIIDLKKKFEGNKTKWAAICGKVSHPEQRHPQVGLKNKSMSWDVSDIVRVMAYKNLMAGEGQAIVQADSDKSLSFMIELLPEEIAFDEDRASTYVDLRTVDERAAIDVETSAGREIPLENVENFFKPSNNAIIRSFNSTRGKGLAGVITSLAFDYGNYPYETKPGSRAPKMIDVALGFSPIHDLPLGLDYNGEMRAPSHPVGDIMKGFGPVYSDEEMKKK